MVHMSSHASGYYIGNNQPLVVCELSLPIVTQCAPTLTMAREYSWGGSIAPQHDLCVCALRACAVVGWWACGRVVVGGWVGGWVGV